MRLARAAIDAIPARGRLPTFGPSLFVLACDCAIFVRSTAGSAVEEEGEDQKKDSPKVTAKTLRRSCDLVRRPSSHDARRSNIVFPLEIKRARIARVYRRQ
jgi:hypothetical protein